MTNTAKIQQLIVDVENHQLFAVAVRNQRRLLIKRRLRQKKSGFLV
ncbi:hypothetical protein RO3G_15262 [Rhizopus delemar RA 99-880]|uniref:Uncharacterized protein n=1 Tax=Rhizopus delemar (strain RA 99-880 / ATCC MYA-4621 / FGSC 9543 / NRRL 43880) TaxID=246409 RepID=I1CQ21_RHIO9|nr:hypothetical protein RO3G_15262 [Rhizopus delemar RA 99-880]|eukprot:EIE90551.1 hypothetical protein RO3G_15262 [Rhizopus delemar RA 99-880]